MLLKLVYDMQAVILAAGVGKRMRPFTYMRPKPMMPVANKPVIQHNLEELEGLVDEVIIVTSYLEHKIRDYFGASFKGISIRYVTQKQSLGTGHALAVAEKLIEGRFIVINGDDLYSRHDIEKMLKHKYCVLAKAVDNPKSFGIFTVSGNRVESLVEKPEDPESNLANTGAYVFERYVFDILKTLVKSPRGEYELTDAISRLMETDAVFCEIVEDYWIPIGYLHDMLGANKLKLEKSAEKSKGAQVDDSAIIEYGSTLNGFVDVGKNVVIKRGTYIEGPVVIGDNTVIGPNAFIRAGTTVGSNCHIGSSCEIKNSVIMSNTNVPHLSYVGDSVIGEYCNLGAGTKIANLRHDDAPVRIKYNEENIVDSGLRKVGAFIADYTKTGIDTRINPGVVIGPCSWTLPGTHISKTQPPFCIYKPESFEKLKSDHIDAVAKTDEDRTFLRKLHFDMITP